MYGLPFLLMEIQCTSQRLTGHTPDLKSAMQGPPTSSKFGPLRKVSTQYTHPICVSFMYLMDASDRLSFDAVSEESNRIHVMTQRTKSVNSY